MDRKRQLTAAWAAASFLAATGSSAQYKAPASAAHDCVYANGRAIKSIIDWKISVSAGQVTSPADSLMQASGRIDARGVVALAFRRDNQVANVAGRVRGKMGLVVADAAGLRILDLKPYRIQLSRPFMQARRRRLDFCFYHHRRSCGLAGPRTLHMA